MGSYAGIPLAALSWGFFVPEVQGVLNVTTPNIGARRGRWLRVGDTVLVMGEIDVQPTLAVDTLTRFRIALPIPSDFADVDDCTGRFATGIEGATGIVKAVITTGGAMRFDMLSKHTTQERYSYEALYQIVHSEG